MNNWLKGKDFISIRDLNPEQMEYLLDLARGFKMLKKTHTTKRLFEGYNAVAIFEWGSTRTRSAFETSCLDLGMGFTYLTNSHMGSNETLKDTIRVLSSMYDVIVYRTQEDLPYLYKVAELADIPVIDALALGDHPTQMLADALTM